VGVPEKGQWSYRAFKDVRGASEEMSSLQQYLEEEDSHFLQVRAEGALFDNRVSYIAGMLRKIPYTKVMEAINQKHLGGALRRLPEIVFRDSGEIRWALGQAVGQTKIALDEYRIAHEMIETKGRENLTAVLVHEMIHCLQLQSEGKTDHGKIFERWCMYAAHSGLRVDGPDGKAIPPAAKKPNALPVFGAGTEPTEPFRARIELSSNCSLRFGHLLMWPNSCFADPAPQRYVVGSSSLFLRHARRSSRVFGANCSQVVGLGVNP